MFFWIFVLNRVSFLRQEPITLFLDDQQTALIFYKCLKLGIKNQNSVLNRVGKSAIFVLNRVRVWGAEPHLPTQGYIEYSPPPPGCLEWDSNSRQRGLWVRRGLLVSFMTHRMEVILPCSLLLEEVNLYHQSAFSPSKVPQLDTAYPGSRGPFWKYLVQLFCW